MKTKIDLNGKTILVTGSPGFIGANLVMRLIDEMDSGMIVSLDNMNDYYDPTLKEYRLTMIEKKLAAKAQAGFGGAFGAGGAAANFGAAGFGAPGGGVQHEFVYGSIADKGLIDSLFETYKFDIVVNLAAQAGVRYSIDHPDAYIESNLIGFYNILEACRHSYDLAGENAGGDVAMALAAQGAMQGSAVPGMMGGFGSDEGAQTYQGVQHLVYASSSSVYGGNKKVPFSTDDKVDNPVSLYAATKKSNELLAHAYSKLYNIPSTGLRFFTVYGPAGRPDMFYFSATKKLSAGETIKIFNHGNMRRDFTYIDDIVEGVLRVMQGAPEKQTGEDGLPLPPYAVYNIGGGQPENLLDYISTLQEELVAAGVLPSDYDFEGHRELVGMQPGDVPVTYADAAALEEDYGFTPKIGIREGLRAFAQWYKMYYK